MVEIRWITVEKHRHGALLAIGPYGGEHWQVLQCRSFLLGVDASGALSPIGGLWTEWTDVSLCEEEGSQQGTAQDA